MISPVVLVHGGAGHIDEQRIEGKVRGVKIAAHEGYNVLSRGGTVVDAVEAAVTILEDDEYFNAGFGAVLNDEGEAELDASIMDGKSLEAGAVAGVKVVKNPVGLARCIMETTPHVLITGEGTWKVAKDRGIPLISNRELISCYAKVIYEDFVSKGRRPEFIGEKGTVGAVACDKDGNVAAATSTGGVNGQMVGRVGDVPLIGCGTYADNKIGAVSCTGCGEAITKWVLAHSIIKRMENNIPASVAAETHLEAMLTRLKKDAGVIVVTKKGQTAVYFTTVYMPWAYVQNEKLYYGYEPNQKESMHISQHFERAMTPRIKKDCICVKDCRKSISTRS